MSNLDGKVVLITGAAKGMGAAEAKMAAERGATVILTDILDDELQMTADSLGASFSRLDVTLKEDWERVIGETIDQHGRIDGLVNNAGIFIQKTLFDDSQEAFEAMVKVNQLGTYLGIECIAPLMRDQGSGSIVNISSVAGKRVMPGRAVYSGTKYAVRAISEGTRIESSGVIQVTCIYPGAFKTELAGSIKDESMLEALMKRGVGAVAQPAERVADAIKYALEQDHGVAVNEIVIRPTAQDA